MFEHGDLGPMLGRCAHLNRERMEARLHRCDVDITPAQTHILLYLHRRGGTVSQVEVTEHLRVKPSTVNGIIDRMEEKGLLRRSVSQTDARCRLLTLTEKGGERHEQFRAAAAETEALLTHGLTEEEAAQLKALLCRVIRNLEEDRAL